MSTKKPKVKSTSPKRKSNAKLGYGETNKNVNTLRKIEQAKDQESEIPNLDWMGTDTSELESDDDLYTDINYKKLNK